MYKLEHGWEHGSLHLTRMNPHMDHGIFDLYKPIDSGIQHLLHIQACMKEVTQWNLVDRSILEFHFVFDIVSWAHMVLDNMMVDVQLLEVLV